MNKKEIVTQLRNKRLTFKEIGIMLGLSRQRVFQIYNEEELKEHKEEEPKEHKKAWTKLSGRDYNREVIRKRDNYTCQICGKVWVKGQRRFDVHHIDLDERKSQSYDKLREDGKNMITLCHKCHLNLDEHRKKMSLKYNHNTCV